MSTVSYNTLLNHLPSHLSLTLPNIATYPNIKPILTVSQNSSKNDYSFSPKKQEYHASTIWDNFKETHRLYNQTLLTQAERIPTHGTEHDTNNNKNTDEVTQIRTNTF